MGICAILTLAPFFLIYGITGITYFHNLSVANIPNSVILASANTVVLLGVNFLLFISN